MIPIPSVVSGFLPIERKRETGGSENGNDRTTLVSSSRKLETSWAGHSRKLETRQAWLVSSDFHLNMCLTVSGFESPPSRQLSSYCKSRRRSICCSCRTFKMVPGGRTPRTFAHG